MKTAFQLAADLFPTAATGGDVVQVVSDVLLEWFGSMAPPGLNLVPDEDGTINEDDGTWHVEYQYVPTLDALAFQATHPGCAGYLEDSAAGKVTGREWSTEVRVAPASRSIRVCIRLQFDTDAGGQTPRGRPQLIDLLLKRLSLRQIRPITPSPWTIGGDSKGARVDEDIASLRKFCESQERRLPIVMLSEPEYPDRGRPRFLSDGSRMAEALLGVAFVVQMPFRHAFKWSDEIGKEWGCYEGAARLYRRQVDFVGGDMYRHKLYLPAKQAEIGDQREFEDFLIDECFKAGIKRPFEGESLRSVVELRSARRSEAARIVADTSKVEYVEPEEFSPEEVTSQLNALRVTNDMLAEERKAAVELAGEMEAAVKEISSEADRLRRRLAQIESHLRSVADEDPDAALIPPTTYAELETWVDENFAGRLVLHSRARRRLKKARYADVPLIAQALMALAGPYRDGKLGVAGAADRYAARLAELHIETAFSVTPGREGELGDHYRVEYPPGARNRRLLEKHLKKGVGDEAECLRIYFFWDADTSQVVVGALPAHLPLRIS